MNPDEKTVRERLKNRRILIIEDDVDLAPRLADLFESWGVRQTDISHRRCVRGHIHGGLDLLCDEPDSFDLICMDIMLPPNEEKLQECDDCQEHWNRLQEEVRKLRDRGITDATELAELRSELGKLAREIRATIDRKAGVKMIIEWCKEMRKRLGKDDWTPRGAILFLTARQEASLATEISEAKEYLGKSPKMRWITKPALESAVLAEAAELLSDRPGKREHPQTSDA